MRNSGIHALYRVFYCYTHGGDMASTWVAKPRVHVEDSTPRKSY